MCGIAGYLATDRERLNRSWLRAMCNRLVHRGPDGYGEFFDEHVALGHRRLSIIDLGGGAQPMANEDGSIQIVFNGEIYNYLELQRDLMRRGHLFRTKSDTEVLVHLYEEEGERMPEFLNGMFAFAIWDARKRELFLARDRFGEKPLYYSFSVSGTRFCFGSELKALRALPKWDQPVNQRAIKDFLAHCYIPDPNTIYEDVFRLKPGHSLTIGTHCHRTRRYWTPDFGVEDSAGLETRIEELRALASDAVSMRMVSDVPLGAFLSGGVDSSGVVAYMSRSAHERVKTFSIGFSSEEFDELRFARLVADQYQTDHYEQVVTPDIHEVLDTLVTHYDEPFGDSSAIPSLSLSRMTRQHVTVALSGDGADEVFGGYRRYRFGVVEQRLRSLFPGWFRHSVIRAGAAVYPKLDFVPQVFRAKATLTCLSQELGDAYYSSVAALRDAALENLLGSDIRAGLRNYNPRENFRQRFSAVSHLCPLQQMQAVDFDTYLPGDILVKVDRASMTHSLESRAPWLDHRIVELACKLPLSFKICRSSSKHIFKQSLAPVLPNTILNRRKMGFVVPLENWLRSSLKHTFTQNVLRPEMEQFVNLREVQRLWGEHQQGWRNHRTILWNLLMLGMWRISQEKTIAARPCDQNMVLC